MDTVGKVSFHFSRDLSSVVDDVNANPSARMAVNHAFGLWLGLAVVMAYRFVVLTGYQSSMAGKIAGCSIWSGFSTVIDDEATMMVIKSLNRHLFRKRAIVTLEIPMQFCATCKLILKLRRCLLRQQWA